MRVFISYTTKDPAVNKEVLGKVEARIKPFAKVFIDLLHNKAGKQRRVYFELRRSDIVLLIVSPKHQSEWVQKELLEARKKNIPVIKVKIKELLEMDDEQIYLMLSEASINGWSVWGILAVSVLACIVVSFFGIWFSYLYASSNVEELELMQARGVFGDSWGGVNAVISAFAFAGVIVTLFLQNRDLNLQRKEMARQREEFEKENETLKYQRFENLFYNMLNLQQEIVAGLKYEYSEEEVVLVPMGADSSPVPDRRTVNRVVSGREVFRYTFDDAEIILKERDGFNQRIIVRGYRDFLNVRGLSDYDKTWIPTIFDHYFRHLYGIVQLVDNQGFTFEDAYKYVALLRGTLSRYELVWVYYYALSPENHELKVLIEKYSLLKYLREDLLTRSKELTMYFNGLGLTIQEALNASLTSLDFEYFLTDDINDAKKYFLTAFWKREEIKMGMDRLKSWRLFIDDSANKIIKEN